MSEDSKTYEVCYLLTTPDAEAEVVKLLTQHQAEILYQSKLADIKLAYPIQKQISALFGFIQFAALPEQAPKIKLALALNAKILRSMIITMPSEKVMAKEVKEMEAAAYLRAEKPPKVAEPKMTKPAVLSNEALEEKLEEILK